MPALGMVLKTRTGADAFETLTLSQETVDFMHLAQ